MDAETTLVDNLGVKDKTHSLTMITTYNERAKRQKSGT